MTKSIYVLHFGSSEWCEYASGDIYYFTDESKLIEFMDKLANQSGYIRSTNHLDSRSFVFIKSKKNASDPLYCFYYEDELNPLIDYIL
jgi:hypothetical protein